MHVYGEVEGVRAAVQLATKHVLEDRARQGEDHCYESMYDFALRRLQEYAVNPQWGCSVPVNYGSIVIV